MTEPAAFMSFAALRAAYAEQRLTPRILIAQLRRSALEASSRFNAYITLLDERQLEPYLKALDGRDPASLPLYGLPFAIKDNVDLAGVPTTAGCAAAAYVPQVSSPVVARLIKLGAIPTGKTNLDQFATGLSGTRSPYGECRNAWLPDYPSGGSSSGSALAVALGLAAFAVGTDTAGSGRVPAALNGLLGCKPSRGILSTRGMVPACRSLDCLSFFTREASEASELLALTAAFDAEDAYSRRNPGWNGATAFGRPVPFRFGVPRAQDLFWAGCTEGPALFAAARRTLEQLGGLAVEIDFTPFLDAARLLYQPANVAERYSAFGHQLGHALPVIREVVSPGADASAVAAFQAAHQLQALKQRCDTLIADLDCMLTPTIPRAFTLAELRADPIGCNSHLGTYTNFMNLLDYAAVAVPAGRLRNGLPWGVTLFGRAFTDQYLLSLAQALQTAGRKPLPPQRASSDRARVVVCGAHLRGLALNHQLLSRGAHLVEATRTAPGYKLYALPGGPPFRPALVRDETGWAIEVEVWELPSAELGSFLAGIGPPLGLGKLQLADGRWETGFICEHGGLAGATDITHHGGWRAYLAAQAEERAATAAAAAAVVQG